MQTGQIITGDALDLCAPIEKEPVITGIGSHQSSRSGTCEWLTPPSILKSLGSFDLDPCAPTKRPWSIATQHFTRDDDGIRQDWVGRVWLNPPYDEDLIWRFMGKMAEHNNGIALVFARTETRWFFNFVWSYASAILFLRGRLNFYLPNGQESKKNASAPSVLISYGEECADILERCGLDGKYIKLCKHIAPTDQQGGLLRCP